MPYLIRTKSKPHFYFKALYGAAFTTWVAECDKQQAQPISKETIDKWVKVIRDAVGCDVEKYEELER